MTINVYVLDPSRYEKEWTKGFRLKCKQELHYDPEDLKLKLFGTWGYVKTNHGLYVLNRVGTGLPVPVSNRIASTEPGQIFQLYATVDGVPQYNPILTAPITLNALKMMEIESVMPLDDFILKLLPASRDNLNLWKDIFNQAKDFDVHQELVDNLMEDEGPSLEGPEDMGEDDVIREMEGLETEEEDWNSVLEDKKVSDATLDTKKLACKIINTEEEVKKYSAFLLKAPCECKAAEVLCCVKKDICSCGTKKSHYHCSKCGKVTQ